MSFRPKISFLVKNGPIIHRHLVRLHGLSDKQSIIEGLPALLIKQNQQVGEESIGNITGDNTFCYLSFVEAYRGQSFQVKVIKVGHYPLRGVATDTRSLRDLNTILKDFWSSWLLSMGLGLTKQ